MEVLGSSPKVDEKKKKEKKKLPNKKIFIFL